MSIEHDTFSIDELFTPLQRVKSYNVLIVPTGSIKVSWFGLMKLIQIQTKLKSYSIHKPYISVAFSRYKSVFINIFVFFQKKIAEYKYR